MIVLLYAFAGVKTISTSQPSSNLNGSPSASFTPISTSFPTTDRGWVLGTVRCSVRPACVQLRSTRDGGATWALDSLPRAFLVLVDQKYQNSIAALNSTGLTVRFANSSDGWIYGTVENFDYFGGITTSRSLMLLWSTHDGGVTWTRSNLSGLASGGPIFDLEASNHEVYLLGEGPKFTAVLLDSPVHRDHWSVVSTPLLPPPVGGSETGGNIALSGHEGWLVEGNDRGITGSLRLNQQGQWTAWSPPCATVGNSYVVPVATDARHLLVVCEIGGVFSQPSPTAPAGAMPGSWWLYVSNDAGSNFYAVRQLHGTNGYFSALGSPISDVYFFFYDRGAGLELVMSRDGGKNMRTVFRGNVAYLHFMNSTDGVGIAKTRSNASEMIMTHNGGRSWIVQSFTP